MWLFHNVISTDEPSFHTAVPASIHPGRLDLCLVCFCVNMTLLSSSHNVFCPKHCVTRGKDSEKKLLPLGLFGFWEFTKPSMSGCMRLSSSADQCYGFWCSSQKRVISLLGYLPCKDPFQIHFELLWRACNWYLTSQFWGQHWAFVATSKNLNPSFTYFATKLILMPMMEKRKQKAFSSLKSYLKWLIYLPCR